MKKIVFLSVFLCFVLIAKSAIVDTVSIYSPSMRKAFKCVVIRPDTRDSLPVVYLLHGHSGDYSNWIMKVPDLRKEADELNLIIVCPDGHSSSWYFDSPIDSTMRYETYISTEVPDYIDAHFATLRTRKARAITGLSMGGHGALFIAFRHSERFGACGSMSGGVDLQGLKTRYQIVNRIGDTVKYAANWINYSVTHVVEQPPKDSIAIIIDCGTEDFFYPVNHSLHEKMLRLKIAHDYIERPGKHDWNYWGNAVRYQLLFFKEYFESNHLVVKPKN